MENNQIFLKSCFTAFKPPGGFFISDDGNRFTPDHQTPLMANSDQSIEKAFSSLNLSSDVQLRSQGTPSRTHLAAVDDGIAASPVSIPPSMAFGGSQQALIWASPPQFTNATISGPFCTTGAHQRVDVGSAFAARGPYLHAGDHNQLMSMNYNQREDFYDAYFDDFGRYGLHGKEPALVNPNYRVPVYTPWENGSCSSWNSSPADQQLYKPQQLPTFEDMKGGIVSLANDHVSSEILNLKLEKGLTENQIDMLLLELTEYWSDLLRNQFGSQFVQKLFALCNEDQRTRIIVALVKFPYNLVTICLNSFGARAILKLLEKLNSPQQISFVVASITRGALALSTDPNGQTVINYCVKRFPAEYTKQLVAEIAKYCYRIATNKSGCVVMQTCLDHSHGEAREQLISEIITNGVHLAEDPYGNYVIQHLLGFKIQEVTKHLVQRFQGCFLYLSCNKYASNVVEKMLEAGEECSTPILMELLRSPDASKLLVDPYANFVVQSALSASKGRAFDLLINLIQVNLQSMQSNLYGKKILGWFGKKKLYRA